MSTTRNDVAARPCLVVCSSNVGVVVECWSYEPASAEWGPLERLLDSHPAFGAVSPSHFMWMASAQLSTGVSVQMYKHVESRRYLRLDAEAGAYCEADGRYMRHESASAAVSAALG